MLKKIIIISFALSNLAMKLSAKEKDGIVFDDKFTVYVHKLGQSFSDRKRIKVDLARVDVKLMNIIRAKALASQKLAEEIAQNDVHVFPENLTGHYQFTLELRIKKNREFVRFDYEFTKEMSHIDKKLADSEEGKLILIFLREITTRQKGNKLQINK
jgi:hypothetical protein